MSDIPSFLPPSNGKLHEYEIRYLDADFKPRTHYILTSKNAPNALRSFAKAVPRHGRILLVRKVVQA